MIYMVFTVCLWHSTTDCRVVTIPTIAENMRQCEVGLMHEAVQLSARLQNYQVRKMVCTTVEEHET